jgi:hypothetical protein
MDSPSIEVLQDEVVTILASLAQDSAVSLPMAHVSTPTSYVLPKPKRKSSKLDPVVYPKARVELRESEGPLSQGVHSVRRLHGGGESRKIIRFPLSGWPEEVHGSSSYRSLVKGPIRGQKVNRDTPSTTSASSTDVSCHHNVPDSSF